MRKISDALRDLIEGNALLHFAMRYRLLNLSRVAEFLRPLIAARTKKEVQASALTMALSRLQRELAPGKVEPPEAHFRIDSLLIHSGLAIVTHPNTQGLRQIVNSFVNRLQKKSCYITVTEGVRQLTILLDAREVPALREAIHERPIRMQHDVAALVVNFRSDYSDSPGFFFAVFQKLYLQNINIIEIASTSNELIMYLAERDVERAFDTLYRQFARR